MALVQEMLCEVERKKFHLDHLTIPNLMPGVISHWEKNFWGFLIWFLFLQILFLWVALKEELKI